VAEQDYAVLSNQIRFSQIDEQTVSRRVGVRWVYEYDIIAILEEAKCFAHTATVNMCPLQPPNLLQIAPDDIATMLPAVNEIHPFCPAAQSFDPQSTSAGVQIKDAMPVGATVI